MEVPLKTAAKFTFFCLQKWPSTKISEHHMLNITHHIIRITLNITHSTLHSTSHPSASHTKLFFLYGAAVWAHVAHACSSRKCRSEKRICTGQSPDGQIHSNKPQNKTHTKPTKTPKGFQTETLTTQKDLEKETSHQTTLYRLQVAKPGEQHTPNTIQTTDQDRIHKNHFSESRKEGKKVNPQCLSKIAPFCLEACFEAAFQRQARLLRQFKVLK